MAINGSFYGTTSNSAIKPKITWSAVENMEGNFSEVTATLSYSRTDSYMTYGYWAGTLTINGDQKSVSGKYIEITKNSNTVAITHTVQVPHNDDGTKTITVSATGGITGTTLTKTTISASLTLTSIPRAASIAATDAAIGSVSVVTIGKKSDVYTYTVAWEFGSLSGYLSENGICEEPATVTASGLTFSLPESFYYEIPDKASERCTLTCTTYLDTTAVGDPQTCTFTVSADSQRCGPLVSLSAKDTNAAAVALTGDENVFIRYVSSALCTMTAQSRYGATLAARKLNGQSVTADTAVLEGLQTDVLRFTATDSRGYTSEAAVALELIPYFVPSFRLTAARTDATSGDATLEAAGSFYNGSFGAASNNLKAQYQINGGTAVTVPCTIDGNSFTVSAALQDLDYTTSHRLTLTVSDAISTVTAEVKINPGIPVFDWGKEDFQFNVPVYIQGQEVFSVVEEAANSCVSKAGDTMTGELKMSGKRVTGLGSPQADGDAANKAYADGKLSMELLWANAAPGSSFSTQTVSVAVAGYDFFVVRSRNSAGTNYYTAIVFPDITHRIEMVSGYFYYREITINRTAGAVVFGDCLLYNSYGTNSAKANTAAIPVEIYGVKGDLS